MDSLQQEKLPPLYSSTENQHVPDVQDPNLETIRVTINSESNGDATEAGHTVPQQQSWIARHKRSCICGSVIVVLALIPVSWIFIQVVL